MKHGNQSDSVPALCDEVEKLRAERDELKKVNAADKQDLIDANATIQAINGHNAVLHRALEMACEDAADGCCPDEMTDYVCPNVQACPNANGAREDLGLDKDCWNEYYIQRAREETEK